MTSRSDGFTDVSWTARKGVKVMAPYVQGSDEDLEKVRFTYHPVASHEQAQLYKHFRKRAKELALEINKHVPQGREQSVALTKLEEVVLWVNAGIAREPAKQALNQGEEPPGAPEDPGE